MRKIKIKTSDYNKINIITDIELVINHMILNEIMLKIK